VAKADKEIIRPYSTHYFTLANDREADLVSRGAASTEEGAIRAAIVRVFMGQFQKAVIYNRHTGVAVYHIRPGAGGISVRFGAGIDFKQFERQAARRHQAWLKWHEQQQRERAA
jgi:hypothetical protein